jgi:hypothetical protein
MRFEWGTGFESSRGYEPEYSICENRLICERLISKILLQCALLIAALIIVNVV